jgi:hypothetical protein
MLTVARKMAPVRKRSSGCRLKAENVVKINRFLDHHNAHSKPFEWAADPDKIIAAVRRGHQALNSVH